MYPKVMIDVKEAVQYAINYLNSVFDTSQYRDILLEEVERSQDDKYWLVTIGYSRPAPGSLDQVLRAISPSPGLTTNYNRDFKVFKIDANTGEVRSMKIRVV